MERNLVRYVTAYIENANGSKKEATRINRFEKVLHQNKKGFYFYKLTVNWKALKISIYHVKCSKRKTFLFKATEHSV